MKTLFVPRSLYLSVKDNKNKPSNVETIRMDNHWLFLSKDNKEYLIENLYKLHKKFGGGTEKKVFERKVPKMMQKYADINRLDDIDSLNDINWLEILHFTNDQFIKLHYLKFKKNAPHSFKYTNSINQTEINLFKQKVESGENIRTKKMPYEITAEDIKSIDVWEPIDNYRSNDNFREKNKVEVWQTAPHKRNYDRGNDGLAHDSYEVASREVPQRGFNMDDIYKTTNKYDNLRYLEL